VTARFPQFPRLNQLQKVDLQTVENPIGTPQRKVALSFQYVVQVGLGDTGYSGEPALGGSTAAHPLAKLFEETLLQVMEGHVLVYVLFRTEIGFK